MKCLKKTELLLWGAIPIFSNTRRGEIRKILTAYNSKYSNSSFTEKKTMQNGFDDSGIRMNTWIAKKNKWTLAEMEERSEYLIGRALSIWAAPVTEYKPEEKQLDRSKKAPHHWFNSGDEDLFLFYSGIEPKQIAGI